MSKTLKSLRSSVLALLLATPALAQDADTVVAVVNGSEITLGEVISVRSTLPQQYQNLPNEVLFSGIIDQLVQQELLAQTLGNNIPKRAALTLEVQRKAILANEVMATETAKRITDDAIQAAYDIKYGNFEGAPEFNASHILVETEEEALAIVEDLKNGADFAETAVAKSTGPSGPRGGQLGWFGPGQMVAPFEEAVKTLEIGEVSGPVETQFGWHVIILNDSRVEEKPTLEAVRPELEAEAQNIAADSFIQELTEAAEIDRSGSEGLDPALVVQFDLLED